MTYPATCPRQVYEFSLNVSKGVADSEVAYGLLRSDVAIVKIEVIPIRFGAERCLVPLRTATWRAKTA